MRIKRNHVLTVICALLLVAVCNVFMSFPRSTTPSNACWDVSTVHTVSGTKDKRKEQEVIDKETELNDLQETELNDLQETELNDLQETELNDLLHTLKSRLDKYRGPLLNLTEKTCSPQMVGAPVCFDAACPRQFSPSLRERLRQVLSTRAPLPEQYMRALASAARSVTSHKYIFVTGASSNHFLEMQALLRTVLDSLLPKMKGEDYALVVYNLGFTEEEKKLTEKNCRCTVVDFPFSDMPESVQYLKCYLWKPLIVASLLGKAEYLTWMDASIRFRPSDPFPQLFHSARDIGFQIRFNGASLAVRTRPSMATFFGDHLCQYSPFSETEANFFILYNERFTREAILKPWVSCALAKDCMCIKGYIRCPGNSRTRSYGGCHRYDQSGLGMILSKLYQEKRSMLHVHRIKIARNTTLQWFRSR